MKSAEYRGFRVGRARGRRPFDSCAARHILVACTKSCATPNAGCTEVCATSQLDVGLDIRASAPACEPLPIASL